MNEWHAIVVRAHERDVRAFVAGFLADRALDAGTVMFAEDVGLAPTSIGEHLRDLVGASAAHPILVPEAHVAALADAVSRADPTLGLTVVEHYVVARVRFGFEVETFAPGVAREVRSMLASLPDGVAIVDRQEEEQRDPQDRGVELYTPVHDYRLHLRGTVAGALIGVVEVRRRLGAFEVVRLGPLEITRAG